MTGIHEVPRQCSQESSFLSILPFIVELSEYYNFQSKFGFFSSSGLTGKPDSLPQFLKGTQSNTGHQENYFMFDINLRW